MSEKENEALHDLSLTALLKTAHQDGRDERDAELASLLRSQADRIRELEGDREEAIGRLGD